MKNLYYEIIENYNYFLSSNFLIANNRSIELFIERETRYLVNTIDVYYGCFPEMKKMAFKNQVKYIQNVWRTFLKKELRKRNQIKGGNENG